MNVFEFIPFEDLIRYAIAVVVVFAGLFALVYILWGGFLMIISGGKEEKVKVGINHIRYAIIGVVFLVVFLFVFPIFAKLLALPYGDYAKPAVVFATIKEISGHIFGTSTSTSIDFQDNSNLPSNFSDL